MGKGGGGSSGEVSWPKWISDLHAYGAEEMKQAILAAYNPYQDWPDWDPSTVIGDMDEAMAYFNDKVTHYNPIADWGTAIDAVKLKLEGLYSDDKIDESVLKYSELLADNLEMETLPRFRAGMRDINAVQSSAFVIGEAMLEACKNREVAKYAADLRKEFDTRELEHIVKDAMQLTQFQLEEAKLVGDYVKTEVDTKRIQAVLKKEQAENNTEYRVESQKWDMDNWTQYGDYIAAMHGGVSAKARKQSKTASAIGGALSGGGMGYMMGASSSVGGPWGAALGAAVGIGSALMS